MDDRSCVSPRGAKSVNYLDAVSGCEGMTVVLRVTGGQYSRLAAPFFIFKNRNENYPIAGTPDNFLGTSYRSQRNGWMDSRLFVQYLKEPRAITSLPNMRHRTLFVDNCSGHNQTDDCQIALADIRTTIR